MIKFGENREHGRPRCRWKDNIKMGLKVTEYKDVNWIWLRKG